MNRAYPEWQYTHSIASYFIPIDLLSGPLSAVRNYRCPQAERTAESISPGFCETAKDLFAFEECQ